MIDHRQKARELLDGLFAIARESMREGKQPNAAMVDAISAALEAAACAQQEMRELRSQAGPGSWFYAPCPKCGAIEGMGLSGPKGQTAVWCPYCEHMGPAFGPLSREADRKAVIAWNREFHNAFQANRVG